MNKNIINTFTNECDRLVLDIIGLIAENKTVLLHKNINYTYENNKRKFQDGNFTTIKLGDYYTMVLPTSTFYKASKLKKDHGIYNEELEHIWIHDEKKFDTVYNSFKTKWVMLPTVLSVLGLDLDTITHDQLVSEANKWLDGKVTFKNANISKERIRDCKEFRAKPNSKHKTKRYYRKSRMVSL